MLCTSAQASAAPVEEWLALRQNAQNIPFPTYAAFLRNHSGWPDQHGIQARAEDALTTADLPDAATRDFFARFPPVTDRGRLTQIIALDDLGQKQQAADLLRNAWRGGRFDDKAQSVVLSRFGGVVSRDDHLARLDAVLWQGNLARAENTLGFVDRNAAATGRMRIDIQHFKPHAVDTAIGFLDRGDEGLAYDVVRYMRSRDKDDAAISVFLRTKNKTPPHAAAWWREQSILIRRLMTRHDYAAAYRLANAYHPTTPSDRAEEEFLAGWLASTRLHQTETAFHHFEAMYKVVKTPISIARAAYWAGSSAAQLHQMPVAMQWWREAAHHMNAFYGQMAAYALASAEKKDAATYYTAFFQRSQAIPGPAHLDRSIIDAARWLDAHDRPGERDMFLAALLNVAKQDGHAQNVIAVAKQMHSPKFALMAAKAALEGGTLIKEALYPQLSVPNHDTVEKALTFAIIRQESQFDPTALSPADARGLMQLMPGTAAHLAKQCGIPHKNAASLFTPAHNIILGQAYLQQLLARYDNTVPLAVAAYNAGPQNVDNWIRDMGDPRRDKQGWVDWVEQIPFYETRNYVERVWESYQTYRFLQAQK